MDWGPRELGGTNRGTADPIAMGVGRYDPSFGQRSINYSDTMRNWVEASQHCARNS